MLRGLTKWVNSGVLWGLVPRLYGDATSTAYVNLVCTVVASVSTATGVPYPSTRSSIRYRQHTPKGYAESGRPFC